MDESKKNQIIALVKSMVKDGTPLNSVKATLKASGLSDDEIEVIISKISPELTNEVKAPVQEPKAEQERVKEKKAAEKIKKGKGGVAELAEETTPTPEEKKTTKEALKEVAKSETKEKSEKIKKE